MRTRDKQDGLPYRTYERFGVRTYSIGYKSREGTWVFRLRCLASDVLRIRECRRDAITRAAALNASIDQQREPTFADLCELWLEYQAKLGPEMREKRAKSTLIENRKEITTLCKAFGPMRISDVTTMDANDYMQACCVAVDKSGNPRTRSAKGWKEIGLARVVFKFGILRKLIAKNPFEGVQKQALVPQEEHYVSDEELKLAVRVGRQMGGPYHVMALCLKTAYLCLRRSSEARNLRRDMLGSKGIKWTLSKRRNGVPKKEILIAWTPELRATIDEALMCRHEKLVGSLYVFGNQSGVPYTKGGWKANLVRLMARCEAVAEQEGIAFSKFNLQHCRPKAVTDYLENTEGDIKGVMEATGHTSERMIRKHYDRRKIVNAKPMQLDGNSKIGISKDKRG
jgi:integrase